MGRATLAGGHPAMKKPSIGLPASSLAVGSSVYLLESGVPVEYLVVNQGIPSDSTLYDESCDGLWLLRKDIYGTHQWHSSASNNYANSTIHSYLNSDFLSAFDAETKSNIKTIKIPLNNKTGANGLSTQIFLLGGYEVGLTQGVNTYVPIDGACTSYFLDTESVLKDSKRIAYLDGTAKYWWLRSPVTANSRPWAITSDGQAHNTADSTVTSYGVRPALILPSTAIFDEETLLFKGVA